MGHKGRSQQSLPSQATRHSGKHERLMPRTSQRRQRRAAREGATGAADTSGGGGNQSQGQAQSRGQSGWSHGWLPQPGWHEDVWRREEHRAQLDEHRGLKTDLEGSLREPQEQLHEADAQAASHEAATARLLAERAATEKATAAAHATAVAELEGARAAERTRADIAEARLRERGHTQIYPCMDREGREFF